MPNSKSFQLDLPEEDRKQIKQIKCRSWLAAGQDYPLSLIGQIRNQLLIGGLTKKYLTL